MKTNSGTNRIHATFGCHPHCYWCFEDRTYANVSDAQRILQVICRSSTWKTDTCAFSTDCSCGLRVNYTVHMIRDTLLNGISDFDIRREILGTTDILTMAVNNVIALVESIEMARNAIPAPNVSVASPFRRQKATVFRKNCCSSSRNSSPANPSKQSP